MSPGEHNVARDLDWRIEGVAVHAQIAGRIWPTLPAEDVHNVDGCQN